MKKITYLVCFAGIIIQSCDQKPEYDNPFFQPYTTPFNVPPFEKILNSHYLPAFREGIKQQETEIKAIINNPEAPDFTNTIEAMERSGQLLNHVSYVFFNLREANTNDSLNQIAEEIMPEIIAHQDNINLNEQLFSRIKTVFTNQDKELLTTEQKMVLQKYYNDFVRGGANLSPNDKERSMVNWLPSV